MQVTAKPGKETSERELIELLISHADRTEKLDFDCSGSTIRCGNCPSAIKDKDGTHNSCIGNRTKEGTGKDIEYAMLSGENKKFILSMMLLGEMRIEYYE